ncbi:hypothetical protein C8R46DRAFT_1040545 [Mycena filopes]|nr:hypothetical protein C8R46DRAFT_1040545 [Mycena filopes]
MSRLIEAAQAFEAHFPFCTKKYFQHNIGITEPNHGFWAKNRSTSLSNCTLRTFDAASTRVDAAPARTDAAVTRTGAALDAVSARHNSTSNEPGKGARTILQRVITGFQPIAAKLNIQMERYRGDRKGMEAVEKTSTFAASVRADSAADSFNDALVVTSLQAANYGKSRRKRRAVALPTLWTALYTLIRLRHSLPLRLWDAPEANARAPPKVQPRTTQLIYVLRGLTDVATLKLAPILERRLKADLITFAANIRPSRAQCT